MPAHTASVERLAPALDLFSLILVVGVVGLDGYAAALQVTEGALCLADELCEGRVVSRLFRMRILPHVCVLSLSWQVVFSF